MFRVLINADCSKFMRFWKYLNLTLNDLDLPDRVLLIEACIFQNKLGEMPSFDDNAYHSLSPLILNTLFYDFVVKKEYNDVEIGQFNVKFKLAERVLAGIANQNDKSGVGVNMIPKWFNDFWKAARHSAKIRNSYFPLVMKNSLICRSYYDMEPLYGDRNFMEYLSALYFGKQQSFS